MSIDLAGAEAASGPVRWARRVLQGGAKDLARSQTYTYAALQMRRSGASAGISAESGDRAEAVTAFVAEAVSLVSDGTYLPDAAKGVNEKDLAPLRDADPRAVARLGAFASECDALSAAVAADAAAGLDGSTVAIEGLSAVGVALAEEVTARGARVVAVSDARDCLVSPSGLDPTALAEAWTAHGDGALGVLAADGKVNKADAGTDSGDGDSSTGDDGVEAVGLSEAEAIWAQPVDIVFAGSKMGVVNHQTAAALLGRALVPCGRLAYTAKALAVCRRSGIVAVADFVALVGSTVAAWSEPSVADSSVRHEITSIVTNLMAEALKSDAGPFLGACHGAEAFLGTWQEELPFGRPLAS